MDIKNSTELAYRQFLFLNERFLLLNRVWTDTDNLNFARLKDVLLLYNPSQYFFKMIIEMGGLPAIAFRIWQACFVHPYDPTAPY